MSSSPADIPTISSVGCPVKFELLQQLPLASPIPLALLPPCQAELKAELKTEKAAAAGRSVMDKTTFAARQQALFSNDAIKAGFIETLKPRAQVSSGQVSAGHRSAHA